MVESDIEDDEDEELRTLASHRTRRHASRVDYNENSDEDGADDSNGDASHLPSMRRRRRRDSRRNLRRSRRNNLREASYNEGVSWHLPVYYIYLMQGLVCCIAANYEFDEICR
jgi:hypothetical protein